MSLTTGIWDADDYIRLHRPGLSQQPACPPPGLIDGLTAEHGVRPGEINVPAAPLSRAPHTGGADSSFMKVYFILPAQIWRAVWLFVLVAKQN